MPDPHTNAARALSRAEAARRQAALRALVAELVATTDGRAYRDAVSAVPAEDWSAFHFELLNALVVVPPVPAEPGTLEPGRSGVVRSREKLALLVDEHRQRALAAASLRVERVARFDVPGVTG